MDPLIIPFAVICSLGLAAVGLSFLALFHTKAAVRNLERQARARQTALEAALESSNATINNLSAEIRDLQDQTPLSALPAAPGDSLNLTKRSQALRMHRRGDSPSQIAAALDVPLQEIDLLLKVHRIVLNNMIAGTKPRPVAGPTAQS